MKNLHFIAFCLLISIIFYSCSKDPENNVVPPPVEEEPPITFADTATIEAIARNLDNYVPTWKQLERFTKDAVRLSAPQFVVRGLAGPTGWGSSITVNRSIDYFDDVHNTWQNDISPALFTMMPPYTDESGADTLFPLSGEYLDKKLRSTAALFLREKSIGRPTLFVNFYPPHIETPIFPSESSLRQWVDDRFIPEKIAEAKMAELVKAEYMIAWPLEFELFIKALGGINDGGFMANYSDDQILSFAEDIKNKIRDSVKAYYHGKLVAHSYNNYVFQDSMWNRFNYIGFDEIHMAFFPSLDIETTAYYMDVQLRHYTKVIQNSGGIPWVASEISVFPKAFQQSNLEDFEKELYETVFTKLENAPIPPKGISVGVSEMITEEAKNYVKNYFRSR